jgi:crossover junction endodeoxyribonuclease RuvC
MRVLGIDCGSEYTGYGVVEEFTAAQGRRLVCCVSGAIRLKPRDPMALKLQQIFSSLSHIIAEHQPNMVAIEDVFYAVNVKSALKLGQVRGVAMLAASSAGLDVAEYSPLSIKSAVVGYGRADKHQVQQMVMRLLSLDSPPQPTDASDALAIAICHIHTSATRRRHQAVSS